MKTIIESSWYDTKGSYEFAQTSMQKFFADYAGTQDEKEALWELLATYRAIIKQEVVVEMEKHIENFKTFYR